MKRRSSDAAMRGTDGGYLLQEKGADKVRRDATRDPDARVEVREERFQTPRHTPFILLL